MRGRSICRPDWLSIAAPGWTSMAARWRSRRSGIHRAPVGDLACTLRRHQARPLLARPRFDGGVRLAGVASCRLGAGRRHRELEADAVGVEEVDRLDDVVVGDPEHLDTG